MRMSLRISSIMMKSAEWEGTKSMKMCPMGWVMASETVQRLVQSVVDVVVDVGSR